MQPDFATLKPVSSPAPVSSGVQPDFATLKPVTSTTGGDNQGFWSKVGGDFMSRAKNIIQSATGTREKMNTIAPPSSSFPTKFVAGELGVAETAGNIVGEASGGLINAGIEAAKTIVKNTTGKDLFGSPADWQKWGEQKNVLGQKNKDTMAAVGTFFKGGINNLPPNVVQSFGNFLNTIGLMGGGKIADVSVESIPSKIGSATTKTLEGIDTGVSKTKSVVSGLTRTKTADEVLATVPGDVSKLKPAEQKFWYDNQRAVATQKMTEAKQLATTVRDTQVANTKSEIQVMSQRLGQVNTQTALSLKEPSRQAMRDASQTYLQLTGEAADSSPNLAKTIDQGRISAAIDSKFEYSPEIGASLKSDLGLSEGGKPLTNQEILDKARGIMQDVSRTAKSGGRTYTPAEYEAMQKYGFLMEQLQANGVDMTEANKFWKEWVPVRDRIVREIKPFDETGTQKMPVTNTINKAASTPKTAAQAAAQIDAQQFVSQLETRLKVPKGTITGQSKDIMSQIEKLKLSQEDADRVLQETLNRLKSDKQTSDILRNMSKFNDAQKAAARAKMIKIVLGAAAALGLGTGVGGKIIHSVLP